MIQLKPKYFKISAGLIWEVVSIGIPTAVIQICLAAAASLTNIAAKTLPDSDLIIAAYGVVQRLVLIGCYVIMGFMQGYQPVASYAFGAKNRSGSDSRQGLICRVSWFNCCGGNILYCAGEASDSAV